MIQPMSRPSIFDIPRFPSHEVHIGNRPMGGKQPIRLQSMTNTDTMDVKATIEQSIRIIKAGADYVRISTPNTASAHKLKEIKQGLKAAGFDHPLIADIHFNANVALIAAQYVEKVRINPGNYIRGVSKTQTSFSQAETQQELDRVKEQLLPLIRVCKDYGTAIRIGTNMGSLSPRIVAQYGNTPEAMVMATFEFLHVFREAGFKNLVVSLKASKPLIMIQAYEAMVQKMLDNNMSYPLHIGITEAGEGENGRIKSALGICSLLGKGIGDTIRVSLTEEPEKEIPFASQLSSVYQLAFTSSEEKAKYTLQKLSPAGQDIVLFEEKIKTIVVEKEELSDEKTTVPAAGTPDLLFSTRLQSAKLRPGKRFIVPERYIKEEKPDNVWPLKECSPGQIQQQENADSSLFLQICCSKKTDSFEPVSSVRPGAIIADLKNCEYTGNLDGLVAISQRKKIPLIIKKEFNTAEADHLITQIAVLLSTYLIEQKTQGLWIEAPNLSGGSREIVFGFLQSAGLRVTRTEFISCPTCARTSFDLQKVLKSIQKETSNLPGLKIAVMGCVVNGPGEMADADFGFVGAGNGKLHLYKGKDPLIKNIEPQDALQILMDTLKENGYI